MENRLYNLSSLEKISGGNTDFIKKMIQLFKEITPKSVQQLKEAIHNNEPEEAGKIAHSMKPSIDQMEISSLHQTIRELERLKSEPIKPEEVDSLVHKLETTLDTVYKQLDEQ